MKFRLFEEMSTKPVLERYRRDICRKRSTKKTKIMFFGISSLVQSSPYHLLKLLQFSQHSVSFKRNPVQYLDCVWDEGGKYCNYCWNSKHTLTLLKPCVYKISSCLTFNSEKCTDFSILLHFFLKAWKWGEREVIDANLHC